VWGLVKWGEKKKKKKKKIFLSKTSNKVRATR